MAGKRSVEHISAIHLESIDQLVERAKELSPNIDADTLKKAYQFSEKAHEGQFRRSGDPYITHPLGVAGIIADLGLDQATIITGLLHDTVEDTDITLEDVKREFGEEVMDLVDGVTKISQMKFRNTHHKQGENIRKMIVAMGRDIRVILVKLADRLHNMRTLNHMPYEKQERIARETLDIYAPLANRLGISSLKVELEDLSFRYMRPEIYYDLVQKVNQKKKEREEYVSQVIGDLEEQLKEVQLNPEIQGRSKHLYSIYKKMEQRGLEFEQIYDLMAFRIITNTVGECYSALGCIHAKWKPVPGRFKDYIALAKSNNYQSLHTTVIGPNAQRIEVQIRTEEMHLIAERGIAAHWKYKEKGQIAADTEKKFRWLRDFLENSGVQGEDSDEYLENVKTDLFETEIYVFTPKGDVKELPEGASPLDFAYAIHTDVGSKCVGAKVNGKIVPLKYRLRSGDTVSVMTSSNQSPSKDWLNIVVTARAKSKIRAYVKSEERKRSLVLGKDLFEKELRRLGISVRRLFEAAHLEEYLRKNGYKSEDEIYIAVGYGKVSVEDIVKGLNPELLPQENNPETKEEDNQSFLDKVFKSAQKKSKKKGSLISVDGMSDIMVRFAKCCNPIPGDSIVGFISRGRGVTIHTSTCSKAYEIDASRQIDVDWSDNHNQTNNVKVRILSQDEPGLLRKISDAFSSADANIINARIRTTKDHKAVFHFDIQVRDTSQLAMVIQNVQRIKGVIGVERE
ncbi:MAG: bifunctional (p)ppGpp synthetase/guanosine-3',5'-bis(diphosphate) 3'-pyrophosphohydrolase [Bdellovibrionota bacterium]